MKIAFKENIGGPTLRIAFVAALFAALLTLAACGAADEPAATVAPAATGAPTVAAESEDSSAAAEASAPPARLAADFELPSATGENVSLASFAGDKNVVLVFYRGFW